MPTCGTGVYKLTGCKFRSPELAPLEQRVRHPLPARVPRLEPFKAQQEPLALVLPRHGPRDPHPSRLAPGLAQPLAPPLGALAVARRRWELGPQTGSAPALAMGRSLTAAIPRERGPSQSPPALLGRLFSRLQACREHDPGGRLARRHRARREDVARVIAQRAERLALLGFGARGAPPSAPCFATGVGPSPGSPGSSRGRAAARGRPRAMNAGPSDPSSAHWAKTVELLGEGRAGWPWAAGGLGQPCHGLPVESPQTRQFKTRGEPRWPCGARRGLVRGGKRKAVHAGADSWTGSGGVAGVGAVVLLRPWPQRRHGAVRWSSALLQRLQEVRGNGNTRYQLCTKRWCAHARQKLGVARLKCIARKAKKSELAYLWGVQASHFLAFGLALMKWTRPCADRR